MPDLSPFDISDEFGTIAIALSSLHFGHQVRTNNLLDPSDLGDVFETRPKKVKIALRTGAGKLEISGAIGTLDPHDITDLSRGNGMDPDAIQLGFRGPDDGTVAPSRHNRRSPTVFARLGDSSCF